MAGYHCWAQCVTLHVVRMVLNVRIDDALGDRIEAAARAAGVSRSQFARSLLEEKLSRQGAVSTEKVSPSPGTKKSVHVRLDEAETAAIDRVATSMGMKRNQWIVKRIRGSLWNGRGEARPAPTTADAIGTAVFQLQQIGRNLNQAVRAVNATAMPDSDLNQRVMVGTLVRMKDEVQIAIDAATAAILAAANGERAYWTQGE